MRKYFKRLTPNRETVNGMIGDGMLQRRFRNTLLHPKLWHLTRSTTAGAVAAGLFAGLIPGPLQMITAALLAIVLRVNLPLALVITLYTNPLTIVPLYLLALSLGQWVTGEGNAHFVSPPDFVWTAPGDSIRQLFEWMISLGPSLAVGLPLLGGSLAVVGYAVVWAGWTLHIAHYRLQRRKRPANKPRT